MAGINRQSAQRDHSSAGVKRGEYPVHEWEKMAAETGLKC